MFTFIGSGDRPFILHDGKLMVGFWRCRIFKISEPLRVIVAIGIQSYHKQRRLGSLEYFML